MILMIFSKVKDKILDAVYLNEPYSNWPDVDSIDLGLNIIYFYN